MLTPSMNSHRISPSRRSLIWALAKQSGKFEKEAEVSGGDDVYENPKMACAETVARLFSAGRFCFIMSPEFTHLLREVASNTISKLNPENPCKSVAKDLRTRVNRLPLLHKSQHPTNTRVQPFP